MKKIFTLSALAVLMFSCQKEVSYEDPNNPPDTGGGGANDGTKLTRVGMKAGDDSITVKYTYTTNTRISEIDLSGTLGGDAISQNSKYTRNANNIITQEIYKSSDLAALGIPQVVFDHTYDDANNRYAYSKITIAGVGVVDSIVYSYSNSRLSSVTHFASTNGTLAPARKEEYTYSGTNVATISYYDYEDQAQDFVLSLSETYEYDSKTNPLLFTSDAVVLANAMSIEAYSSLPLFYSSANYTKLTAQDTTGSYTFDRTFTYNSNNRPATATVNGGQLVYTYYYE
ncbi:MAG: hypothetical protein ACO1OO_14920 [Flavisolibacter sp.]